VSDLTSPAIKYESEALINGIVVALLCVEDLYQSITLRGRHAYVGCVGGVEDLAICHDDGGSFDL
jgi:hypothetical protein